MEVKFSTDAEVRELMAKKRKLITATKRAKRKVAKLRVEKNKVNEELKKIKARFATMTSDEARAAVAAELDAISTDDIFPEKMERDFDRLDRQKVSTDERQVVDLTGHDTHSDGSGTRIHSESDGDVVVVAHPDVDEETESIPDVDISEEESQDDEEVIDLSDE